MNVKPRSFWNALFLGSLFFFAQPSRANIEIPFLSGPVIDEASFLSVQEKEKLANEIYAQKAFAQVQIWTLPSLQGQDIETLSIRAAEAWKLGDAQKDNGVLIIASRQDRRIRIEVGRGLEGAIPDIIASRIIQSLIVPHFRTADYYEGLSSAVSAVFGYAGGEISPEAQKALTKRSSQKMRNIERIFTVLFLLLFFVFPWFARLFGIASLFGSRRGRYYGSSWGGGGWGGGGGGWSGGGGSFGGGGSSGSW